jgi:aminoglycoside phosphotransferase (APT) family kinase protein
LQKDIEATFHEFMDDRMPETLLHGDIGHGNIITSPNGPVFLDWAETYIGHPFLCSEHLVADLTRSNPLFAQSKTRLRSHYAACWAFFGERDALDKVVALAPAMAAFAYAVIAWDTYRDRPDPTTVWPLLRSMLRRTKFEFEQASEVMA